MNIIERIKTALANLWKRMKQWGGGGPGGPKTPP